MKCINCIHYKVCQYHIDEETDMTVNECPHKFKHKDQYVELPAYIGQPVWLVHHWRIGKVEAIEGKVSMLQQKSDKSWKIRVTDCGSVSDYTVDDIGKYVFMSKEAAIAYIKQEKELT